jgi:hypothetical protein
MKKPRVRLKKSGPEPKLDRELRPHLLYAMMQALAIIDMAEPRRLKRLERVEKDCAGLAERSSGAAQMLANCTAKLARQYIDSLKMAGESADAICKSLGKMAR